MIIRRGKKDNGGWTALHLAAMGGHLEVVKYFLEKGGAEVNVKDNCGSTALHLAAWNGHLEVLKYLLEKGGAEANVKPNFRRKGKTEKHIEFYCKFFGAVNKKKEISIFSRVQTTNLDWGGKFIWGSIVCHAESFLHSSHVDSVQVFQVWSTKTPTVAGKLFAFSH